MLAIQPVSLNSTSKNVAFKNIYDSKESYERERGYFVQQGRELDGIINDNNIPDSMKAPFKWARILTNGVVDGLAVGWAVMTGAKSCQKAVNSKTAKSVLSASKPIGEGFIKAMKNFGELIGKGFKKLTDNKFGNKVSNLYDKIANSKYGNATIDFMKKSTQVVVDFVNTVVKAVKSITFDKASKTTAGILGGGSGVAGAYATAREENPVEIEERDEE